MFRSEGGVFTPGRTEKHRPCPWPSPWYGSWPRTRTFTLLVRRRVERGEDLLARRVDGTLRPLLLDELGQLLEVGLLQLVAQDPAPGLGQHGDVGHVNFLRCAVTSCPRNTVGAAQAWPPSAQNLQATTDNAAPRSAGPGLPAGLPGQLPHHHHRRGVDGPLADRRSPRSRPCTPCPATAAAAGRRPRGSAGPPRTPRPRPRGRSRARDSGQQLVRDLGGLCTGVPSAFCSPTKGAMKLSASGKSGNQPRPKTGYSPFW